MIVLAIMSLGVAIVLPRGSVMLDRMTAQVVFFEFQQAMSEARRDAFRSERARIVAQSSADDAAETPALPLRAPWTYRLDQPTTITAGGLCSPSEAEIRRDGRRVMRLRSDGRDCRFIRLD